MSNKYIKIGFGWVSSKNESNIIDSNLYCMTRDIYIARLDKLRLLLEKKLGDRNISSLVVAITGEIGNNSFDHNLGQWRDVPGIYFAYDLEKRIIVLADRGQGVKKTIKAVIPSVKDDLDALRIALTKTISGRAPEQRGNGLKFVAKVAENNKFELFFQSGLATAEINKPSYQLRFQNTVNNIQGTIVFIKF